MQLSDGGGGGENERCERNNRLAQVVVTGEGEGIKGAREQICDRYTSFERAFQTGFQLFCDITKSLETLSGSIFCMHKCVVKLEVYTQKLGHRAISNMRLQPSREVVMEPPSLKSNCEGVIETITGQNVI